MSETECVCFNVCKYECRIFSASRKPFHLFPRMAIYKLFNCRTPHHVNLAASRASTLSAHCYSRPSRDGRKTCQKLIWQRSALHFPPLHAFSRLPPSAGRIVRSLAGACGGQHAASLVVFTSWGAYKSRAPAPLLQPGKERMLAAF